MPGPVASPYLSPDEGIAGKMPARVARASSPCDAENTGKMPVPRTTRDKCGLERIDNVDRPRGSCRGTLSGQNFFNSRGTAEQP